MNHERNNARIALPALAALSLLSSACMIGPKYQRPSAPAAPGFKEPPPAGWKEAQPADGALRGKWWEIYQDPQLNALEEQVNISNQNVLAAEAQFREAKAAVRIARSGLFPTVTAGPSITGSQAPPGVTPTSISGVRGVYTLPFDATYQVDLWGSIRRGVTASVATAQASAADLANIRLMFQAELAEDYYQLHGTDGDEALLTDTVKSYEEYLKLTKDRYDSGVASMSDVAQAQTQLETTRAQLVDLGVQRAQLEHAIAILTGKPPSELSIAPAAIKTLPPPVPAGVPSALLERRPDIAAAERQTASANEQIGIAMAAYYPNLTLGGSAGLESTSFLNWFTWPSRFWSVGPQLAETLFDAGKRHAQVNMSQAAYDNTVATYRQTVLTAFQQVEDNLAALRILAQEAEVQTRAVAAAQDSLTLSTAQYTGGIANYLQVITSQAMLLQNQRTDIDILTRRMVASVQLIEALGGGWDASQLPATKDLTAGK
jgi:NodT family efflux transporter outer membrane factor (OMF) lipoprotein